MVFQDRLADPDDLQNGISFQESRDRHLVGGAEDRPDRSPSAATFRPSGIAANRSSSRGISSRVWADAHRVPRRTDGPVHLRQSQLNR